MIRNYLLITFRGMLKNKAFIAINVFGMGIAIACCIVAYLAHNYDSAFDDTHLNRKEIYRVSEVRKLDNVTTRYGFAPVPLGEIVEKTTSDVNQSSRYLDAWSNFRREDDLFPIEVSYVDPEFFSMFTFEFIAGSGAELKDKSTAVISEALAIRLFNTPAEALGKAITQVAGEKEIDVKIAGVFKDQPANSSFYKRNGIAFVSFDNYKDIRDTFRDDDWRNECTLFVRIGDESRVSQIQQQLNVFVPANNKAREDFQIAEFSLDNLDTMAHQDRAQGVPVKTWAAPPFAAIVGTIVMGTLILLIACFNLTNTTIALSARRLKEIGIRKVMGSMRLQLIIQFVGETTSICFVALLVGLAMSDFLVAGWNILSNDNVHLSPAHLVAPEFILFLLGVLFFTGILAGSYPAFYISRFEPVRILKGTVKFGGTNYFTRILLGLQFVVCMVAIATAIGFFQNAQFQRNVDLGFDPRGSMAVSVNDQKEFDTYRDALQSNSDVKTIAGARTGLFSDREHSPVKAGSIQTSVDIIEVGDYYLDAMGLTLIEGRDFIRDSETDRRESIVITQKMAKEFGWEKAVGKEIVWRDSVKLFVVGVVKDVYTQGLWHEMEPMMIRYVAPEEYEQLIVSTSPDKVAGVDDFMKEQWSKVFPNRLYSGKMLDGNMQMIYDLNVSIIYSYGFLGSIAMLLSVTGLFSLVSLNIVKRMKEIGVRKVLGASVYNIARVINMEFIIIFAIAVTLGSWAAFNWTSIMMASIWKYYQPLNGITFIVSISLLFTVSVLTIGYKIFSVVTMNPVKSLKEE